MTKKHMRIYLRRLSLRVARVIEKERDILVRFYAPERPREEDPVGDNVPEMFGSPREPIEI